MEKDQIVYCNLPVTLPTLPNFIKVGVGQYAHTVPVSTISPDDLREIGKAWTEALVAHALRRRTEGE